MVKVFSALSVSVDGYITGRQPGPGRGLGDGTMLFDWYTDGDTPSKAFDGFRLSPASARVFDELAAAVGVVVSGRTTYDDSGWSTGGGPHPTAPLVVLSHRPAPDVWPAQTFVSTGIEDAIALARQQAGGKDVALQGGGIVTEALKAGLVDELVLHQVPVLLGGGRPCFRSLPRPHRPRDRRGRARARRHPPPLPGRAMIPVSDGPGDGRCPHVPGGQIALLPGGESRRPRRCVPRRHDQSRRQRRVAHHQPPLRLGEEMLDPDVRRHLDGTSLAHLATVLPDGSPHTVPLWIGTHGDQVVFLTGPNTQKARNLRRNPRVALSLAPAESPFQPVIVRGRVTEWLEGDDAWEIIDRLATKYTGQPYPRGARRVVALVEPDRQTVGVR